jgi:CRP-like cAMP-binding protein
MDILAFIDRSDFFQGVSPKSKELLADICIPKNLSKKEVLFHEGEKGYAFYLLASGAVRLCKGSEDGRDVLIKIIGPGEPFAEVILFERDTYPVTAVAVKPSIVFLIPKQQFYGLLDNTDFRNDFISMLMRKQRYLTERIRFLTVHDAEERFFLFIKEHFGAKKKVQFSFSKKDIAAAIGTTPETYSRLIARLVKEDKVEISGKNLILKGDFS